MRAIFSLVFTLSLSPLVACNKHETQQVSQASYFVTMQVSGMTCESCAKGIKGTLNQYKEVQNIEVKVKEGVVSFDLIATKNLTDKKLKELISGLGFKVKSFTKENSLKSEKKIA